MTLFQSPPCDVLTIASYFPANGRRLVQHAKGCEATFVNDAEIVAGGKFMAALPGSRYATCGIQVTNFVNDPNQT
jgi:hypothetical protein